jgi:hypothetical protein
LRKRYADDGNGGRHGAHRDALKKQQESPAGRQRLSLDVGRAIKILSFIGEYRIGIKLFLQWLSFLANSFIVIAAKFAMLPGSPKELIVASSVIRHGPLHSK